MPRCVAWSTDIILTALRRYHQEFGALPGSKRYKEMVRNRTDYPSCSTIRVYFGTLKTAAHAANIPVDLRGRIWTSEEIDTLEAHAGILSYETISKKLGRHKKSVGQKAYDLGINLSNTHGRLTTVEVGTWLHYHRETISEAAGKRVFPDARLVSGRWLIWPGSLLAAEGVLYADRTNLHPDIQWTIEHDYVNLSDSAQRHITAWQEYRVPGKMYAWRHGELHTWWLQHMKEQRAQRVNGIHE